MTGADSPVMADSSTRRDALDDVTVAGDDVAGLADHQVADAQLGAGHPLLGRRRSSRRATVSVLALRRVSACALPRPSATASARLAKIVVSHSQAAIAQPNQSVGSLTREDRGQHGADQRPRTSRAT